MCRRVGPDIITDGLVFAVDAANPDSYISGSTLWNDQTVNQNNGTLTNGPTFDSVDGGSINLDGVNDYIDFGNPIELQFTTSFSISLWFKSSDTSDYILIAKDNTVGHATNDRSWALWGNRYSGTNVLNFTIRNGGSSYNVAGTVDHNDGNWHHLVATYESSTALKVYVDGSLEATNTTSIPSSINNVGTNVNIGRAANGVYYANAKIDEVGLFNSVLSASDVTAIYNSGAPQSLDSYSPVGWWRFEEGSGTTATDSGSGGNDGTLVNGTSYSSDVP